MRRPSVPAPLLALLGVAIVLGITWSIAVAPFQPPDEPDHVSRIQRMVEGLPEPTIQGKKWSTQEETSVYGIDALRMYGNPEYTAPWDPAVDAVIRDAERGFTTAQRVDLNGRSVADDNPRGYYLLAGLPFRIGGHDFFTKLWAVRLAGVLTLLLTVGAVWALIGELTARNRLLQVVGAGFAAMQPMVDQVSTSVSPDGLLIATWSLTLWLAVRVMRHGPTVAGVVALVLATALACWVKTPGFALVPAVVLALGVAAFRRRWPDARPSRRRVLGGAAAAVAALAVVYVVLRSIAGAVAPQLAGTIGGIDSPRRLLSYLWQYYLPRPGFLQPIPDLGENRVTQNWLQQAWGVFGNLDTPLPGVVFDVLRIAGWVVIVLAAVTLIARRSRIDTAALVVLAVAALTLLLGLHVTEYRVLIGGGGPFLQGRYILPAVALGGLGVAAAVAAVPRTWRPAAGGVVLAGSLGVQLVALYVVLVRFYAA